MRFSNLIKDIKSIRDYKMEPVAENLLQELLMEVKNNKYYNKDKMDLILFSNGQQVYESLKGKAGYFGNMIKSPYYLLLVSDDLTDKEIYAGYLMELARLKAFDLGLGSCFLNIDDSYSIKKNLNIDKQPLAFISIGEPYTGIFRKDISIKPPRLGVEDMVYENDWGNKINIDTLTQHGLSNILYYSKYAPSWGNKEPWKFVVKDNKVLLYINKDIKDINLHAGIIMLYIEQIALEEGISSLWDLSSSFNLNIDNSYTYIGCFSI